MNWEEIFVFSKIFQKHPPRIVSHFKQVKGLLIFFSKYPPFFRFPVQTSEGANFLKEIFEKSVNLGVHFDTLCPNEWKEFFSMARLSKKLKQEWAFFLSPKTGRRTYNDLCRKCRNDCKQSFRVIVVSCPLYCSKRSVKSTPNGNDFKDSG